MKLSLYTAMRDCRSLDYPYLEMLRHHLPLADEIIVHDGYSKDGTYESIAGLDPKIKVIRSKWERPSDEGWWIHFKDAARRSCTGDWCIHLDSDEFIPEWEFRGIRDYLETTADIMIPVSFLNFYGDYRVYHADPGTVNWITRKMVIHRNREDIEFWGDGSNVRLAGTQFRWNTSSKSFSVHHFGAVRHPGRLRRSWWTAGRFRTGRTIYLCPPQFVFNLFPHNWRDPQFLPGLMIYDGLPVKAVRDNPERFIRDGMELYRLLKDRELGVA